MFRIAELREAKNRDLAEGRAIVLNSDAHRLWEIGEAGDSITLDVDGSEPEAVRRALFRKLREGTL